LALRQRQIFYPRGDGARDIALAQGKDQDFQREDDRQAPD